MSLNFGKFSTAEQVVHGVDLKGKTILLTGCNSGLGFESLRVLTKQGAHVLALARTLSSAEEACSKVAAMNGPENSRTTAVACNLEDFISIGKAIDTVLASSRNASRPIDGVLANAGIMSLPNLERIEGLEKQFFVNHIGHFTLITGIIDAIRAAKSPRIVITSSAAHMTAPRGGIRFENLNGALGYNPWVFYGQSKLANILFANALSKRLSARENRIDVNSLHPGVITATGLARNMSPALRALWPLARFFGKSIEQGAATQCMLIARPEAEGITGSYFANCRLKQPSAYARNEELAQRLWDYSVKFVSDHAGRQIKI